jgi:threonyl-tRNA synthetase
MSKAPFALVIGDKEVLNNTVTYRPYGSQEQVTVSLDDFINMLKDKIAKRG